MKKIEQCEDEQYYIDHEIYKNGYITLAASKHYSKNFKNDSQTARLLASYFYGTPFNHLKAYGICTVSDYWPNFIYYKNDKNYICTFNSINMSLGPFKKRTRFDSWFNSHRKVAVKRAVKKLEIDWNKIEKYK